MQRTLAAAGSLFVRLARDESGGEAMDYAVVAGAVATASFGVIGSVGEKVTAMWQALDDVLAAIG